MVLPKRRKEIHTLLSNELGNPSLYCPHLDYPVNNPEGRRITEVSRNSSKYCFTADPALNKHAPR